MVSRKEGCPKTQKPCARLRDAERDDVAVGASGDPAMVFRSKMASILPMVRAFYPLSPSRRIAAGHAAWIFKIHALIKCMILSENRKTTFPDHAKTRTTCARELYLAANVVLFEQGLVARLVLALDVIEQ